MSNISFEPHVKGGFSERKGIRDFSSIVQIDNLTHRTRNLLYERIKKYFSTYSSANRMIKYIYIEVLSMIEDNIPKYSDYRGAEHYYTKTILIEIYHFFEYSKLNELFDFLEAIGRFLKRIPSNEYESFKTSINDVFEEENVNYRYTGDIITDLTSEVEIKSIDDTLKTPYDVVNKHFSNAMDLLYHTKDFGNSIKESISAVEAMCQIINGGKEELNKSLKSLKIKIHPALEQAYIKLYAYTCDENGVRHANGVGEKDASFAEARYMLVSCSAFINYLKEKFEEKEN